MFLGDIVDQFHNRHGLANTGTAKQADLATLGDRHDEINYLDTGLEDFHGRRLVSIARRFTMDRQMMGCFDRATFIARFAQHVQDPAKCCFTDWHGNRRASIRHLNAALETIAGAHGNTSNHAITQLLLDLQGLELRGGCLDVGIDHGADTRLHRVDQVLDELGLAEDTIFIFSSDNGGETKVTSNAPLRGGKRQLYEGGIRVPLIVRWPKGEVPAGKVCSQPVVNHDFYPTLLEAAGIQPDPAQTLDGVSTLATWKNPETAPKRKALHWQYPLDRPHILGGVSGGAIREGNWKLIEYFDPTRPTKYELFDLAKDPSEKKDLASAQPKRVCELQGKLAAWRE